MSGCIHLLSYSHSPVFLLNSCLDLFSAPRSLEDPFSLSYGVSLPSSLTVNHPSASVYSTRPRVSVYGTGDHPLQFSGFSRESGYRRCHIAPKGSVYCQVSARGVDLPAPLNAYALQPAIPSAGGGSGPPSPLRSRDGYGNVDPSSVGQPALKLASLRPRLTLIRLALIRKPWSSGVRVSHPHCRYSCLHLLFRTLQPASRRTFRAVRNAPLPIHSIPRLRRRASRPFIIHTPPLDW